MRWINAGLFNVLLLMYVHIYILQLIACLHRCGSDKKFWCNAWEKNRWRNVLYTAALNQPLAGLHGLYPLLLWLPMHQTTTAKNNIWMSIEDAIQKNRYMTVASPDKSLYISTTVGLKPPLPLNLFLLLLVFLLCWHVTRQDTAHKPCPSFWLGGWGEMGVASCRAYISIVAGVKRLRSSTAAERTGRRSERWKFLDNNYPFFFN